MKYWSNQKYHYKIINEENEIIAHIHCQLSEAENFVLASHMQIKELFRTGIDSFEIKVISEKPWKI